MKSLLGKVRERIRALETSRHLEYWLQDVVLAEDTQGGELTLMCPNAFSVQWLSGRHGKALSSLFREEAGRDVHLTFQIGRPCPDATATEEPEGDPAPFPVLHGKPEAGKDHARALEEPFPGWNPRFRFSTFVTGRSNSFAWSAAKEVSSRYRSEYNPLLIHAPTGLGKTHLGQAIGCDCFHRNGNLRILWRTAEEFFAEMIRHMKAKDIPSFKTKYREACDVLILDDIQFLKGKSALQAELCYTLDVLKNRGKQVVLLGNLPARGANGLDENLDSRIFSGLAVTMEPPDYETRLAIVNQFARASGVPVPQETLARIARLVCSHVRDLEGAFNRLIAMQALSQEPIDPETIDRLFRNPGSLPWKPIDPSAIRDHVAKYFGLAPEALSSRSRKRKVHYPRQIGMYLARKHTHGSLESIGHMYDRNHASVLHAIRSLEQKMRSSDRVCREIRFIEEKLLEGL